MPEGIRPKEIKRAVQKNRKLTREVVGGYDKEEKDWTIYDSSLANFGGTFDISLPKNLERSFFILEVFEEYIERILLDEKKRDLTAVEFGGPGSKLFSGFTPGFFKKTVGVCLKDIRSESKKENDKKINHSIIIGDILEVENTYLLEKVRKRLGVKKTDLIISRMAGALDFINKNGAILDRIIRNLFDLLNENGLMFVQFSYLSSLEGTNTQTLIEKWANAITERFPQIDIQVEKGVLRLHKKAGAPEHLPPATVLFSKTKKEEGT